ncbi:MAG: molybdopterin-dependent oxidoreductase [Coriobacteriales bacterium]|jgi:anaerobic selenocysteine-containing dehydrogenase
MELASGLTRRGFVKAGALAGAAAAFGTSLRGTFRSVEKASAQEGGESSGEEMYKSTCHGCIQACPCLVYVKDGVAVRIEGDPDAPTNKGSLCMKGMNQIQTCYSPRRILHPLKRVGERGGNDWEVISWDDAIDLAATKIAEEIDKYGPYAFFASVGGGGSYSFIQAQQMPAALGSPTVFEPGCAQCYLPREAMSKFMYGGNSQSIADCGTIEPFNWDDPKMQVLVLWGAQPSVSQTSQSGRGMADLRALGCKTVVIDPNLSPDAAHADVWLPVRPGTDTALLLSWFRYIFENKLYNEEFTKYWTNLPFLIDPDTKLPVLAKDLFEDFEQTTPANTPAYVCYDLKTGSVQPFEYSMPEDSKVDPEIFWEGEYEGKTYQTAGQIYKEQAEPWTFEKASEVTWVDADTIKAGVDLYTSTEFAGICNGVASDMTESSSQVPLGCLGLDMIMGHVDKPGCTLTQQKGGGGPMGATADGVRPTRAYSPMVVGDTDVQLGATVGASDEDNAAKFADFTQDQLEEAFQPYLDRLGMVEHKGLFFWNHSHIPTVRDAIETGEPFKPRIWYDFSGNKLAMLGNATSWYNVLPEIDFIMGQYPMLTSFHIEAADLVFPVAEWLEIVGTTRQINKQFVRIDVTHLGETVDNTYPYQAIFKRLREITGKEYPSIAEPTSMADQRANVAQQFGAADWDDLLANQDTYIPKVTDPSDFWAYDQYLEIVDDGLPAGFATESRKCEVYCTLLLKMGRTGYPFTYPMEMPAASHDYSPICEFIEPAESPLDDDEYPLVITSGRVPYFHHGTMRHCAFARELYPEPDVRINPKTAAEYGIENRDWVKITSRRGEIRGRAFVTEGVSPGVLWMERFWNPECFDASQKTIDGGWSECNINVLTKNDAPFNEVFGSYTNRGFTVKIEKSEKPDNVWVEPEEFRPFMPTLQSEPRTEDVY